MFRSPCGAKYESEPGNRYGELRPVSSSSLPKDDGCKDELARSFGEIVGKAEEEGEKNDGEAVRRMVP
jgi:hypothetical protein